MPKNIAVFADGTGNSSAKLFRTNVWRLYQALDLSMPPKPGNPPQVAYYDDGVGTSSFRPLAILGGAFGWGLKRNVLDGYKFICRNYQEGDRIYLFGFSRGAFTVRVLASFICQEGLVEDKGNEFLERYASEAYRNFRHCFDETGRVSLVPALRYLRDRFYGLMHKLADHPDYQEVRDNNRKPWASAQPDAAGRQYSIEFIGVWDTVAAYGLPIAEMTRGIDKWVWPLSMPDYLLSEQVKTARHALALDDERDTFHPLLWDEEDDPHRERIKQVWFAGMHSDVGGGYPEDTLAHAPLEWMLEEAVTARLVVAPTAASEIRRFAASVGPLHDSRRGAASYYRYQPRKLSARLGNPPIGTLAMQDPTRTGLGQRARLRQVNIHESVLQRIATGTDGYAPIVISDKYQVVPRRSGPAAPREIDPTLRTQDQERVWDWVWHKRINYFLSVGVSLFLGLLPLLHWMCPPSACTGPQCMLSPVISTVGEFLPGFAHPWIAAFAETPGRVALAVVALVLLVLRSGALEDKIRTEMRILWRHSFAPPATRPPDLRPLKIRRLRHSLLYQKALQTLKWRIAPHVFGPIFLLLLIAAGVWVVAAPALRLGVWANEIANQQCAAGYPVVFETPQTCYRLQTGVIEGARYRVTVKVTEPWSDLTISTSPEGFGPTRMSFKGNLLASLRRAPSARWFQPLVKIVSSDAAFFTKYSIVPLEMRLTDPRNGTYAAEFVAPTSGDAQFFINDVLLPKWTGALAKYFYSNNQGKAEVDIEQCTTDECSAK